MARKKLGEILIEAGVLEARGLRAALDEQTRWGGYLGHHLVDMRLIEEGVLIQALSRQLGLPCVSLDEWTAIPADVVRIVDGDDSQRLSAVPFRLEGRFVDVAMGDPMNTSTIDELQILTRLNVRPYIAGPKALQRALNRLYGKGANASVEYRDPPSTEMELITGSLADQTSATVQRDLGRRAEFTGAGPGARVRARTPTGEAPEVRALQERISRLEQLLERDEGVLRKLLSLLIDKGIATREEIAERIK